jgi:hypothetical protein
LAHGEAQRAEGQGRRGGCWEGAEPALFGGLPPILSFCFFEATHLNASLFHSVQVKRSCEYSGNSCSRRFEAETRMQTKATNRQQQN